MSKAIMSTKIICCLFALLLAGCGGGSGGGSSSASFDKWSDINPPTTVTVDGISQEATYTAPAFAVTNITNKGVSTSSSASIKYRADGTIERITINTPFTSVTWDETSGDMIDDTSEAIGAVDSLGSDFAVAINPLHPAVGWEYQAFGVWETGRGTGSGTVGAITIGAPSTGSAIPVIGNATFLGMTAGTYLNATGTTDYITASSLMVDVDFLDRELNLTTTGTEKISMETGFVSAAPNLDMMGTLNYAAGANAFTGNVSATGLAGTSTGRFYGPNAEELGGVFGLYGNGLEHYSGGYGATR